MKKTLLLSLILLIISIGFSYETPASMMYANSYLQRGTGANSIYWNPANLKLNRDYTWDFVTLDFNINLYNNSISLETYDRINGKFLEEKDREALQTNTMIRLQKIIDSRNEKSKIYRNSLRPNLNHKNNTDSK